MLIVVCKETRQESCADLLKMDSFQYVSVVLNLTATRTESRVALIM